ncbi:hypothetical protein [Halomonas denitrificans]|nr:hypothetical protein [Halomonas denitrificans]
MDGIDSALVAAFVALLLGIGNWLYDSWRRGREVKRQRESCEIYLLSRMIPIEARYMIATEKFDEEFGSDRMSRQLASHSTNLFHDEQFNFIFDSIFPAEKAFQLAPLMKPETVRLISSLETVIIAWNRAIQLYGQSRPAYLSPERQLHLFTTLQTLKDVLDSAVGELERNTGSTLADVSTIDESSMERSPVTAFPQTSGTSSKTPQP